MRHAHITYNAYNYFTPHHQSNTVPIEEDRNYVLGPNLAIVCGILQTHVTSRCWHLIAHVNASNRISRASAVRPKLYPFRPRYPHCAAITWPLFQCSDEASASEAIRRSACSVLQLHAQQAPGNKPQNYVDNLGTLMEPS